MYRADAILTISKSRIIASQQGNDSATNGILSAQGCEFIQAARNLNESIGTVQLPLPSMCRGIAYHISYL